MKNNHIKLRALDQAYLYLIYKSGI